ncbi:hypothetical protein JX265_009527 [Neoarthrinium moseri]|uniref:Protein kinase domain-containing protein n=1 Tax=Neoarthrinium moseri TaxID=1658444 RepID=A0A9P9WFT4_9PEZI|nr:hypothetical protein JX265_009527 [Neoarthrinium moseri]
MSVVSLLSDLVRDSKIETEFLDSCIQHVFYETGPSARERRVRKEERWVRREFIGRGAYGSVYLEQSKVDSSYKLRAVKEIKKSVAPGEEVDYIRELEAVAKFSHQKKYLTTPFPESETRQIASQVLEGLIYMHENGFVHRDLKPGNIMVVTQGPDWFVKIADFGISKRRQQGVTTLHTMQRGTLGFVAPEVLGFYSNGTYTYSVDMWSFGAVIYRIITNTTAFGSPAELFKYSSGIADFPTDQFDGKSLSCEVQEYISALMKPDPKDRLSAVSASSHPWIAQTFHSRSNFPRFSATSSSSTIKATENPTLDTMGSKPWTIDHSTQLSNTDPPSTVTTKLAINTTVEHISTALAMSDTDNFDAQPTRNTGQHLNYQPPSVTDCVEDIEHSPNLPDINTTDSFHSGPQQRAARDRSTGEYSQGTVDLQQVATSASPSMHSAPGTDETHTETDNSFAYSDSIDHVDANQTTPEVNKAWAFLKDFEEKARTRFWTCPKGHRLRDHLKVTSSDTPVWKTQVACPRCPVSTHLPIDTKLGQRGSRMAEYCIFCGGHSRKCRCARNLDEIIQSLVNAFKGRGMLTQHTKTEMDHAMVIKACETYVKELPS